MNRRGFLRGAFSVMVVAGVLKGRAIREESPIGLASIKQEGTTTPYDDFPHSDHDDHVEALSRAMARSMTQTRENIASRAFSTVSVNG